MLIHHPANAVKENIVPATCTNEGSYDEVVYCLDDHCGHKELSRKTVITEKIPHTEVNAVKENEVAPTCYAEGSYDSVVYCSTCKAELSRKKITVPKTKHTPAEAVVENRVEATCTTDGKYDEVVYCSVEKCRYEISRLSKTIPAKGHTPGAVATCTTAQKCTKCLEIISPALGHTWGEWANSSYIGGYEGCICEMEIMQCRVCTVCNEMDDLVNVIPAPGHTWGEWENALYSDGYEGCICEMEITQFRTCTVCNEMDDIIKITPAPGHDWKDATCTEPKTCQRTGCKITDGEPKGHNFGEWVIVKEATTKEEGLKERTCFCGYKETEMIPIVQAYILDGDYIYFGEYPQTIKADDVTITSTIDERGYYLGSDGHYYAKVTATPYPYGDYYTFSTGASVTSGIVYYFKVEPIRWRILSEENGEVFLLCDSVIAAHQYDAQNNKYAMSDIRLWLNSTFYETAFDDFQKLIILITEVDNSMASAGSTSNSSVNENTHDRIFLLSYAEATNSEYGFTENKTRRMLTSDYSRATGAGMNTSSYSYYGNGEWWLRSPITPGTGFARVVGHSGESSGGININATSLGVVPALRIRLEH